MKTSTPKMNGALNGELPTPELSPLKTISTGQTDTLRSMDLVDGEVKKKRYSTDKAYFIAKELLMTERTYRKDLEVLNMWLREMKWTESSVERLLELIEPIAEAQLVLLSATESTLSNSESSPRIIHLFLDVLSSLSLYADYLGGIEDVLCRLGKDLTSEQFHADYSNFEKNKICYLPLSLFILKPLQRLLHYAQLLDRLMKHYGPDHQDYVECEKVKAQLTQFNVTVLQVLTESENHVQLVELSRDLGGFEGTLTDGERRFIRQGCLAKFSQKKGYQQRMFFLLSDMLLYTILIGHMFKVHGQLPLKSLALEQREDNPSPNSFTIYTDKRAITVSASSQEEKDKWLEDLTCAVEGAKNSRQMNTSLISLKCSNSSDDVSEKEKNAGENNMTPQRSNTTVHVCWHRNTSVCLDDHIRAAQNQLSGYLLRKFKNSNGWQKLWVVFTNFCLFFYKTFQDEAPLASLPLLGYTVAPPSTSDGISKDFVFKLQFKNHVYFFRAESQYTFDRWMEVIGSATLHSGRMRLFSRKESTLHEKSFSVSQT